MLHELVLLLLWHAQTDKSCFPAWQQALKTLGKRETDIRAMVYPSVSRMCVCAVSTALLFPVEFSFVSFSLVYRDTVSRKISIRTLFQEKSVSGVTTLFQEKSVSGHCFKKTQYPEKASLDGGREIPPRRLLVLRIV